MTKFVTDKRLEMMEYYSTHLPRVKKPLSFYCPHLSLNSPNADNSIQELSSSQTVISIICPISLSIQSIPVRTLSYTHLQTCDLKSIIFSLTWSDMIKKKLLLTHVKKTPPSINCVFQCPICLQSNALYVDQLLESALPTHPSSISCVTVSETGDVIPVLQSHHLTPEIPPSTGKTNKERRFSFNNLSFSRGDTSSCKISSLGERCVSLYNVGLERRYTRLPTIDLTVDSPR